MPKLLVFSLTFVVLVCGHVALASQNQPTTSEKLDTWLVALIVGMAVGSEEICGHVYDREKIDAFVSANVDPDDNSFEQLLSQSIEAGEYMFRSRKDSAGQSCSEWQERAKKYGIE